MVDLQDTHQGYTKDASYDHSDNKSDHITGLLSVGSQGRCAHDKLSPAGFVRTEALLVTTSGRSAPGRFTSCGTYPYGGHKVLL